MLLAGIHFPGNNGCPIKAFGHDVVRFYVEIRENFFNMLNTIGR
jgi:hypothetical protein